MGKGSKKAKADEKPAKEEPQLKQRRLLQAKDGSQRERSSLEFVEVYIWAVSILISTVHNAHSKGLALQKQSCGSTPARLDSSQSSLRLGSARLDSSG